MSSMIFVRDLQGADRERFQKRVELFYSKHNPEKLNDLSGVLSMDRSEDSLFDMLCNKYSVAPHVEEGHARQAGVFPGQQKQKLLCPYTQLPLLPEIPFSYSELFTSSSVISNDSALYYVNECKTIKSVSKQLEALLVISHPVVFECTSSGAVAKSLQITEVEKLITDDDAPAMLGIVTKDKSVNLGDLLLKFSSAEATKEVINCLSQLYKAVTNNGTSLPLEKMLFLHPTRLSIKEQTFTTSTRPNRREDLINKRIPQWNQETLTASPKNHPFKDEGSPKPPPPPSPTPPPPPPISTTPTPTTTPQNHHNSQNSSAQLSIMMNLDQLRGEEQRRARKRIELFYNNHAPQELTKAGKLDTIMSLDATETKVIKNLCTKYRVPEELEREQAAMNNLLPKSETSQNNINENNSINNEARADAKVRSDDAQAANSWRPSTPIASQTSPERRNAAVMSPVIGGSNNHDAADMTSSDITPIRNSETNNNNNNNISIIAAAPFVTKPPMSPQQQQPQSSQYNNNTNQYQQQQQHLQIPCTKCKFLEDENRVLRRQLDDVVDENKQLADQLEAIKLMMLKMAKMQGIDIPNDLL